MKMLSKEIDKNNKDVLILENEEFDDIITTAKIKDVKFYMDNNYYVETEEDKLVYIKGTDAEIKNNIEKLDNNIIRISTDYTYNKEVLCKLQEIDKIKYFINSNMLVIELKNENVIFIDDKEVCC